MKRRDIQPGHAVIVGGGLSGLLMTIALAKRFEQVTLVDRRNLLDEPASPILLAGIDSLDRVVPGLSEDLVRHGVTRVRPGAALGLPEVDGGLWSATSDLVEALLRARIRQLTHVRLAFGCEAAGMKCVLGSEAIESIEVRKSSDTSRRALLKADLFVLASGENRKLAPWLGDTAFDLDLCVMHRTLELVPGRERRIVLERGSRPCETALLQQLGAREWALRLVTRSAVHACSESAFQHALAQYANGVVREAMAAAGSCSEIDSVFTKIAQVGNTPGARWPDNLVACLTPGRALAGEVVTCLDTRVAEITAVEHFLDGGYSTASKAQSGLGKLVQDYARRARKFLETSSAFASGSNVLTV